MPTVIREIIRIFERQGSQNELRQALHACFPFDSANDEPAPRPAAHLEGFLREKSFLIESPAAQKGHAYLPLEAFKWFPEALTPERPARTFLSSGTTQRDRSRAIFSESGLRHYQAASIATFHGMLRDFFSEPTTIAGISLVPSTKDWPDSSLAQMVSWIGEIWPLQYATSENLALTIRDIAKPVWLFGTAIHFADLFEQGFSASLPQGSIVIETGGTKGRRHSFTRPELYEMIEKMLGLPQSHIVSEYGMCELASQAYDWVRPGANSERSYRFPAWVRTYVSKQNGEFTSQGEGCLSILDPLRTDLPLIMRTQDIGRLKENGFQLLGRVPSAALKGCSLNVEAIVRSDHKPIAVPKAQTPSTHQFDEQGVRGRLPHFINGLKRLLKDGAFMKQLEHELGSEFAAAQFRQDIQNGLPKDDTEWLNHLRKSLGKQQEIHGHWLVILSQSHPQVGFYPLGFAYLLGLSCHVRRTATAEDSVEGRYLRMLSELPDARIKAVGPHFYIGASPIPKEIEAIMCFGGSETIARIQEEVSIPVKGFGDFLTASMIHLPIEAGKARQLIKDCLSLKQQGCMSSRLVIAVENENADYAATVRQLEEAAEPWVRSEKNIFNEIAMHHEWLERKCFSPMLTASQTKAGIPFFPLYRFPVPSLRQIIARKPYVIPVLLVKATQVTSFYDIVANELPELRKISSDIALTGDQSSKWQTCPIGNANAPLWDGTHEGGPLFEVP